MRFYSYGITDIGLKRQMNQDAYLRNDTLGLYLVADGMGGHRGGEVASQLAVTSIAKFFEEAGDNLNIETLEMSIQNACHTIYEESQLNASLVGMGTTVVAVWFHKSKVIIGQVGDSRVYLHKKPYTWQLTEDHSLVNETMRSQRLSPQDREAFQANAISFKNVLTRSVGYERQVKVDIYEREFHLAETYFLCSDGLSGHIEIWEINDALSHYPAEQALHHLTELAKKRGGEDNITALVCQRIG